MGRPLGLAVALIAGFLIFYFGAVTPRPAPLDAPAADFSAGRAMVDVRAMGSTSHPLGSPADARVRDYLMARMTALGLSPRLEHGAAFESSRALVSGGAVDNVIGVLPGRDRTAPALALMAHHDSVRGSPGAADDTAGVASALELIRAIETKGTPDRDVMLVITDGEEAGLLGARAFFEDSPVAAHVGYVINMATRGGGGLTQMFETAPGNGGDIALYRRTADHARSNALTVFVYQHMRNDTDFTVAKAHGKAGLNYAFIGREFDYHSLSSTPAALDQGSLQHMGSQILPTAVALAFGPLPARAPDVIYADVPGGLTLVYPAWGGWLLLIAAAGLIGMGAWRARLRGEFATADLARGLGAGLYGLFAAVAALELARRATGVGSGWMAYRPILARFPLFEAMMLAAALGAVVAAAAFSNRRGRSRWIAAVAPLAAGAAASLFGGFDLLGLIAGVGGAVLDVASFGAPAKVSGSWTGVLVMALILATVGQALAPTAGFVLAWPLLAAAVASGISAAGSARRSLSQLAVVVIAAITFAWIGNLFHSVLQGLDLTLLPALAAWLAALLIWPLATPENPDRASLAPAATLIGLALAIAAALHLTSPWTARHPNAVEPLYVDDPDAGKAWRETPLKPDAWSLSVLTAEGGAVTRLDDPLLEDAIGAPAKPVAASPAPVSAAAAPDGAVTVVAGLNPGAAALIVALRSPTGLSQVRLNGKPVEAELGKSAAIAGTRGKWTGPNQWGRIYWAAPEGYTLTFHTDDPAGVELRTAEVEARWMSVKPLPPMPKKDQAWDMSGSSLVLGKVPVRMIATARAPGS
jgi:hypothetical protein